MTYPQQATRIRLDFKTLQPKSLMALVMSFAMVWILAVPMQAEANHFVAVAGRSTISASGSDSGTFTLVLRDTGEIFGSGANDYGQLGTGDNNFSGTQVQVYSTGVLAGKTIVSISSGESFALALDDDGKVYAWGDNASGQLGDGSTTTSFAPVEVDVSGALEDKKIVSISAGPAHALALDDDGVVYAWGENGTGQLGDNTLVDSSSPIAVSGGSLAGISVEAIAAGGQAFDDPNGFSVALGTNGRVYTWGSNKYGQLGIGNTTNSKLPVAVDSSDALSGKTVVSIAAGSRSVLALDSDGFVSSWGGNSQGQLGDGTTSNRSSPVEVDPTGALAGKVIKQIAAGYLFSLAVDAAGVAYAWGGNVFGELGDGTQTGRTTPVAVVSSGVLSGEKIVEIKAGYHSAVALTDTGKVVAWGYDGDNQAGLDYWPNVKTPQASSFTGSLSGQSVTAASFGNGFSIFLDADGVVHGVGYNGSLQVGTASPERVLDPVLIGQGDGALVSKEVVAISAGVDHSLALDTDGKVYAWGVNGFGQLGIGTTVASVPTLVEGVLATKRIVEIAAGGNHSLALDSDGVVYAWGRNASGQLGTGDNTNSSVPVVVSALSSKVVNSITAGESFSAALTSASEVYTWGKNNLGQLGNGSGVESNLPIEISSTGDLSGKTITRLVAGGFHALALDSNGSLYGWGANYYGQLGDGTLVGSPIPKAINGGAIAGKTIASVDGGADHSLVIDTDGVGYSWGYGVTGQLGNGTIEESVNTPSLLDTSGALAGKRLKTLSADVGLQSFALDTNNVAYAWGDNINEQLGIGPTEFYRSPFLTALLSHAPAVESEPIEEQPATNSAPVSAPYQGPMATSLPSTALLPGESFTILGLRLNLVASASIDNQNLKILSQSPDALTLLLPETLTAGTKNLVLVSSEGLLTLQDAIRVGEIQVLAEQTATKLNAGSFKGFVAIYARGHQGKRLSAKVGKDWIVIPSLKSNFERIVDRTGANIELSIKLYINRELVETMNLKTR